MLKRSLSARLLALWLMLLASSLATGFLMMAFYRQSATAQVDRAVDSARRACADLADRFDFYGAGGAQLLDRDQADDRLKQDLRAVAERALSRAPGVEGGFWSRAHGALAYAFPTYEGSGPKTDLPEAETPRIRDANMAADRSGRVETFHYAGRSQTLVLTACPLAGADGLTGWTMTRVFTGASDAYRRLLVGVALLGATVLGSALWLGRILLSWTRRIRRVERELAARETLDDAAISPTGEREIDRLVEAVNVANARLATAQRKAASDQRLAAIGLLAAGVAHEIRNPIAAMRLKAENALASDDPARKTAALTSCLSQIERLDRVLRDLLTVTERPQPRWTAIDVDAFLAETVDAAREHANGVVIDWRNSAGSAAGAPAFDRDQMRRALDNLMLNAIQHTPPGGRIDLTCRAENERLVFTVADSGSGVSQKLRDSLFQPFVTGRAEGVGLGLAIVEEIARAHSGFVRLVPSGTGARFEVSIPWRNPLS